MRDKHGFAITDEELGRYSERFERLDQQDRKIAVALAHQSARDASLKTGIPLWTLHRRRAVVLAVMDCSPNELPRAIFGAIGIIGPYSI